MAVKTETKSWDNNATSFNVSEIIKKIKGVSYLSKFYFQIEDNNINNYFSNLIKDGQGQGSKLIELQDVFFYSQGITIPSRGINTENYSYSNGFRIEIPTGTNYGDNNINIPIMSDNQYILYNFFIKWMDKIHSKETGYFSFHSDYTTNLKIKQLDYGITGKPTNNITEFQNEMQSTSGMFVYGVQLTNCYPKAISAIEFRHDSKEKVEFNVNMSYEGIIYLSP